LLSKWPVAGTYHLWPVNMLGSRVTKNPIPLDVSPDHEALRRPASAQPVGMMNGGGITPDILSTIERIQREHREEMAELRREIERERKDIREQGEKLMRDRAAVGLQANENLIEMQTKLMERDTIRTKEHTTILQETIRDQARRDAEMNKEKASQIGQAYAVMMTAMEAQRESERQRMDSEMRAAEVRRESEREMAKEMALARELSHREFLEMSDRSRRESERAQQKAWEAQMELVRAQGQNNPLNNLGAVLSSFRELKEMAGDVLPGLLGGGEQGGVVSQLVGAAKDIMVANMQAQAAQAQAGMRPRGLFGAPQGFDEDDDEDDDESEEVEVVQAAPAEPARRVGVDVRPEVRDVAPKVQKVARGALRGLVAALVAQPDQTHWRGIIIPAIQAAPEIIAYVEKAAIQPALIEAGADVNLASTVVAFIDSTGLVPANIPRR